MLQVITYVVSIVIASAIGWQVADLTSRIGLGFGYQIAVFCSIVLFLLVIAVLAIETESRLGRILSTIGRWIASFFRFIYYVIYQLGDEIYNMAYPIVTDRLKVYKNGKSIAVWHIEENIPDDIVLLGIGTEDCDKAMRGQTVTLYNNGCIELMPVAPGFKSNYKPA